MAVVGNLEFISQTVVSASTSSFDVDNVFSDKYDVYMVSVNTLDAVSTASAPTIRAITGGSADSGTNYDYASLIGKSEAAFIEGRATGSTNIPYLVPNGYSTSAGGGTIFYVFNPYDTGSYTFFLSQMTLSDGSVLRLYKSIAVYKQANAVTGLQFNLSNAIDNAEVSVYGLASN